MACPDFRPGRGLVAIDGAPKYLAIYELESFEVLDRESCVRIFPPGAGEERVSRYIIKVVITGKPMSKPVHVSIRDDLRMRLAAGEWALGERLPSETDLAAQYGVARMTIRQAIGTLASEGIVVRRQGLGTFAVDRPPIGSADELLSLAEEMQSQGHQVQTRLINAAVEQPSAAAREALQLGQSAAAVTVRRLRLVDGRPVVAQNSWLPYARFAGLDVNPLLHGSLYAMLETHYGVCIVRARQIFTAAAADQSDAAVLGLRPREPVLRIARTTYDSSNRIVEFTLSVTRSGYPVETIMERRPPPVPPGQPGDPQRPEFR